MDLTAYPTEMLLQELNSRGMHGVVSLASKGSGRLEVWWGDRVACLGLTARLTSSINFDMDRNESAEEAEEEGGDDGSEILELEFPQIGQYL